MLDNISQVKCTLFVAKMLHFVIYFVHGALFLGSARVYGSIPCAIKLHKKIVQQFSTWNFDECINSLKL